MLWTAGDPAMRWTMIDMQVYRDAFHAVLAGESVYSGGFTESNLPYLYPPFALVVLAPLALVPLEVAKVVMSALNFIALAFLCRSTLRSTGQSRMLGLGMTVGCAGLLLLSEPVQQNFMMGQVNLIIAALALADFVLPSGHRAKGVIMGLLTGVKLTPGLFVLYYLLSKQYAAARNAAISFAGSVVIGGVLFPADSLHYWSQAVISNRIGGAHLGNQSLKGALLRIGAALGVPDQAISLVWLFLFLLLGAGGLFLATRFANRDALTVFCCLATVTLLISPLSWTPHWVLALPMGLWLASRSRTRAATFMTLAIMTAVLFAWPVDGVPSGIVWTVYPGGFWGPGAPLWHGIAYYTLG
ncbi:MAG: glycosyltransferase 87 family protein, partial [Propionibacteriaceae bacterium]|nr:glycosyltransferase 87 family protein [Propionibacteriaceae bacterium]